MATLVRAITTDSHLEFSNAQAHGSRLLPLSDRHTTLSDLESAVEMLEHAVEHLVVEQVQSLRAPVQANRDAIAILCQAVHEMVQVERRSPTRSAVARWLSGAALFRANCYQGENCDW